MSSTYESRIKGNVARHTLTPLAVGCRLGSSIEDALGDAMSVVERLPSDALDDKKTKLMAVLIVQAADAYQIVANRLRDKAQQLLAASGSEKTFAEDQFEVEQEVNNDSLGDYRMLMALVDLYMNQTQEHVDAILGQ